MVNNGMEVPADGILIQSAEVTADESAMTGETEPMKKDILLKCVNYRNTVINPKTILVHNVSADSNCPYPIILL